MAIISFDYNFIFIKTRKTAGTSIEVDLSQYVEQNAIVTPILPLVEGHSARNFQNEQGEILYFNHMSASQIRERLGIEKFTSMFKFCIERDPITKSISHYHMYQNSPFHNKDGIKQTWDAYCEAKNYPTDHNKYSEIIDGKITPIIDKFIPYESLHKDLPVLLASLGLENFTLKSQAKSNYSKNVLIRPNEVTENQRSQIIEAFEKTLAVTGLYS